jgi:hypothetical protein
MTILKADLTDMNEDCKRAATASSPATGWGDLTGQCRI